MVLSFTYSRCDFEKYQSLLPALKSIVENPQPWDDVTLSMSSGLLQHLNGFLFCLLIALFNKILQHHLFCTWFCRTEK